MGGLMLGLAQKGGIADIVAAKPKLTFFLGADEADFAAFADSFKVYVGHHGDKGAAAADVVLPGASYAEKSGTWVNLEGRVQRGERAVFPPGDAARTGPSCARSPRGARQDPAVRHASRNCARRWASTRLRSRRARHCAASPGTPPALDAKAKGPARLSDQGFLSRPTPSAARPRRMQRCSAELIHGEEFAEAAE